MSIPQLTLNDGSTIPQLAFGVGIIYRPNVVPAVLKALEIGYRHIDTASFYKNEEDVGQALRESGLPRDQVLVTTKVWHTELNHTRRALEQSLDRLKLDYVDFYLIHWPKYDFEASLRAWAEMEQAREDGLVRSIGVANFTTTEELAELLEKGRVVPALNQVEYHPTYQLPEVEAAGARHGVVTEAYSALGIGQDLNHPVVTAIAQRLGRTAAQVILRWHLQKGRVAIARSSTPARIAENFAVTDFDLQAEDIAAIDSLSVGNRVCGDPVRSDQHEWLPGWKPDAS